MKIEQMLNRNKGAVVLAILGIIIVVPIAYYLVLDALPREEPFLEKPDPKYEECVKDVDYMRFYHMDLLKEIRDEVVREGITSDISLEECRDCHTDRSRFCNQCHNIVNLNLDCFGCHNYPETAKDIPQSTESELNVSAIPTTPVPGS
jgi:hypothetical protein